PNFSFSNYCYRCPLGRHGQTATPTATPKMLAFGHQSCRRANFCTGTNLPSAQVGVGFNHSVPVQSVTARGVRMSGRISYFRLTVPVRAFCLYGLVAGLAPAYGAMVFPPDPDPNNLNAFSLFLTEQESVDYYRRAAGTPLMPITGLLVGGGVRYDLDQIAP